ncbi:Npun_F0813 family protein [Egbenema bharatensis]|uniref:Npun_F0813 family protein n=1 Tax=Egbenema bharatensis TaxID=3463334 RepID=UPI003A8A6038
MFILKRQDVDITTIQHPKKDQQIPILHYQGQTFRLLSVFNAAQEEDAKAFWRELTDNRGKACVLLEEPERYSVWGKVRLDQGSSDEMEGQGESDETEPSFIQACLLLLQAVYIDIEDLLGARQVGAFQKEITDVFRRCQFPQADSPTAVNQLLTLDPLTSSSVPPWQEHHLNTLLQELYRLGKQHFGNASFTERVMDVLQDMPMRERGQFMSWLKRSPNGKLWH